MGNLFDYITWRGDLDFEKVPFGKIDALLFAQISYCLIDGFVSENFDEKIKKAEDPQTTRRRTVPCPVSAARMKKKVWWKKRDCCT